MDGLVPLTYYDKFNVFAAMCGDRKDNQDFYDFFARSLLINFQDDVANGSLLHFSRELCMDVFEEGFLSPEEMCYLNRVIKFFDNHFSNSAVDGWWEVEIYYWW